MKKIAVIAILAIGLITMGCSKSESSAAAPAKTEASAMATKAPQSTGVPDCDSYLAALDKYMACEKVPQAARDAQKQSAQQMRTSWASWSAMPDDQRKAAQAAAASSCSMALNSLKQAATATGCPVQ